MTDHRDYYQRDIYPGQPNVTSTGGSSSGAVWAGVAVLVLLFFSAMFLFGRGPDNGTAAPDIGAAPTEQAPQAESLPAPGTLTE